MPKILDSIGGPQDLRKLSEAQLVALAEEIRAEIVKTVSATGGHLAPNLGVVELTLALHTVFDSPRDKIIWDVGHQSYAHKLVTGRKNRFHTLRQLGGLSGFPKRKESPHDVWETGHSSTSVSAAYGFARARDLQGEDYAIVAVIGDGALTAGMAWEALNNIGHSRVRTIVVLNDNSMSISPNVGAVAAYLNRLRTEPTYSRVKDDIDRLLKKIPRIGSSVAKTLERVKDSVKYLVLPGMLFEELGFTYLGPVDGHNLAALQAVFRSARQVDGPVLVHVMTKKGKGYAPAERYPENFHGTGPFNPETGKPRKSPGPPDYSSVFGSYLCRIASQNPSVVAVTAAMTSGTGLSEFALSYPGRFFDVGIAEQHAVTFAAGMAMQGLKPVVAIYSTFLQRAFDQVLHDVCIQNLPVTFVLDRGGVVGADGETHQGVFDLAYLRIIPNMVVMAPKDENELGHMLRTAIDHSGPVAIRFPRGCGIGAGLADELTSLPLGKAELLRSGTDVALVAIGSMVHPALEAAEQLAARGVQAAVVNARFVKPLDGSLIGEIARRTGFVVTIEEGVLAGGFGSAVLEHLFARGIDARVRRLGLPDLFLEHGDPGYFLEKYGLTPDGIFRAACELIGRPALAVGPESPEAARGASR